MTCVEDGPASGTSVADAMLPCPKLCPQDTSVGQARTLFADDHVHALLVVATDTLLAVVEPADLTGVPASDVARRYGRLRGRVVGPHEDLPTTWRAMVAGRRRRLAVVGPGDRLLGLLCLKRSGRGFCSRADVEARALERSLDAGPLPSATPGR